MPRSFRVQISLLSVLLSGLVLVGFGVVFLLVTYDVGLERIDRELKALAESQLRNPRPYQAGEDFERSLRLLYGEKQEDQFIFKAYHHGGDLVFASPHWPGNLRDEDLKLPEVRPPDGAPPLPRDLEGPPPPLLPPPGGPRGHGPQDRPGMPPEPELQPPRLFTAELPNASWRIVVMSHRHATMVVGKNLDAFYAETQRLYKAFFILVPLSLLLLGVAGWVLAGRALRPVHVITRTAAQVTARGLDQRIPRMRSDVEFADLINVINVMLERLERSFQQAVRFSADAAHELKTPLTILQGHLEQSLQDAQDGSAAQRNYGELLEEVQRLRAIIRKLLLLSQADAGQMRLSTSQLNLSGQVEAMVEDTRMLAPDLDVRADISPDIYVQADEDLVNQVLHNLASNAVKYNQQGGSIEFHLAAANGQAVCTISNTGEAMSDEERGRIFERFYRGDPARNRKVDGVGLGLSLAREIVHNHQGSLTVENGRPGWIDFIVTLPLSGTP